MPLTATSPVPDRFVRWPLYSGVALMAIVCTTWVLPSLLALPLLFVLCLPAVFIALVGSLVVILWGAALAVFRYRWRQALSMLALPVMLLLTVPVTDAARWVRDETRFYLHKGRYEAEVAKAKTEGKQYVVVDDWSVFVTANSFVVWDVWDKPEEVMMGFRPYQSFGEHFYLVGE